jgi:hypothetical protein
MGSEILAASGPKEEDSDESRLGGWRRPKQMVKRTAVRMPATRPGKKPTRMAGMGKAVQEVAALVGWLGEETTKGLDVGTEAGAEVAVEVAVAELAVELTEELALVAVTRSQSGLPLLLLQV